MTVGPVARDAATAEFLDGTAAGQFLLRHCTACGALSAPQAMQCERCASTALDWRPASGDAMLVSWSVAYGKPDPSGTASRTVLGIAELAEGPWWWSQIVDADPAELRAGTPLRISFERHDAESEAVPVFAPAPAGDLKSANEVSLKALKDFYHNGIGSSPTPTALVSMLIRVSRFAPNPGCGAHCRRHAVTCRARTG